MKAFFKTLFILLSVFSVLGIFLILLYYIVKNIDSFKSLINTVNKSLQDLDLSNKEVDKIAAKIVKAEQLVEKDIKSDIKQVKKIITKEINKTLNSRQNALFDFLKLNSSAKMGDVGKVFKKVTPRTLRRDFQKLEQMGLVRQEGKTKDAVYKII